MIFTTHTDIVIPFHDIDSMNVAWHGHYVKYLEVARCEFLDALGYNYDAMKASGYMWPVVDMRLKYVKPLLFGQRIRVTCDLEEWEYRLKIRYRITDADTGVTLTKAYTIQVAVDSHTHEMCFESPPALLACIKPPLSVSSS